jgi:hypothetical protein
MSVARRRRGAGRATYRLGARPDLWESWVGNRPGRPGKMLRIPYLIESIHAMWQQGFGFADPMGPGTSW